MSTANPRLKLAADYVERTGTSVFLTGKAGTGKTTFLHDLKKRSAKRLVVTAPTGVAAINAGGVTLHSFFQLPFGPMVPGDAQTTERLRRFRREKKNIIASLDLLVIDEISMVRADLLDGVDQVLRRLRRSDEPFGGVQLLLIGDLHQLPPVVRDEEWRILSPHYRSPYFFSSQALARMELATIELEHIYRQADTHFIGLLNQVRDNRLDEESLAELNQRYRPDIPAGGDLQGAITLCTHNRQAETINEARLTELAGAQLRFEAAVEGDFPEYAYPTLETLTLKPGAQVMFVRNDASPDKRYFNGKIGTVVKLDQETVRVKCGGDETAIEVEPATWENIAYRLDQEANEIKEEKIGAFTQYPLKLAWAITIHKSQGLTFDRAVIDAGGAFAHGQVYVALSRCRTLEGVVLSSPLTRAAVQTDPAVAHFSAEARRQQPTDEHLAAARSRYQQRLLGECFDFGRLRHRLNRLLAVVEQNGQLLRVAGLGEPGAMRGRANAEIFTVGENFGRQLARLNQAGGLPETDPVLRERAGKAAAYFEAKLTEILAPFLNGLLIETDNKELAKRAGDAGKWLQEELAVRLAGVRSCHQGFAIDRYLRAISAAQVEATAAASRKPKEAPQYLETDIEHPELFQALRAWRSARAAEEGVPAFRILHQKVLIQLAVTLPANLAALSGIKGIGGKTAEKYGDELLELVAAYREAHGIEEVTLPEPRAGTAPAPKPESAKKPKVAGHTRQVSFDLLESGLSPDEIARERGLTPATVLGHLEAFVASGQLAVSRLVAPDRQAEIEAKALALANPTLGELKRALAEDYAYGEIKLVLAHLRAREREND